MPGVFADLRLLNIELQERVISRAAARGHDVADVLAQVVRAGLDTLERVEAKLRAEPEGM